MLARLCRDRGTPCRWRARHVARLAAGSRRGSCRRAWLRHSIEQLSTAGVARVYDDVCGSLWQLSTSSGLERIRQAVTGRAHHPRAAVRPVCSCRRHRAATATGRRPRIPYMKLQKAIHRPGNHRSPPRGAQAGSHICAARGWRQKRVGASSCTARAATAPQVWHGAVCDVKY